MQLNGIAGDFRNYARLSFFHLCAHYNGNYNNNPHTGTKTFTFFQKLLEGYPRNGRSMETKKKKHNS